METNQTNINNSDEIEIDLGEVFRLIIGHLPIILLVALIGALCAFIVSKVVLQPQFVSSSKIYVMAYNLSDSDKITTSDLQAGTLLSKDYEEIIKSRHVAENVISRLNLTTNGEPMVYSTLLKKVSVTTPSDSRVITISCTDGDPYIACDIVNAVREVSAEQIQSIMDMTQVKTVEEGNIPTKPSGPNTRRNVMIGGLAGALLAAFIVILRSLQNDTILTSDDVERYLGVSTLGTIPLSEGESKSKKLKRRHLGRYGFGRSSSKSRSGR